MAGVIYKVSAGVLNEGERLHTTIDNRFITIFKNKTELSCIDSICHHAGGPLTLGALRDIEDLSGLTVVLCPWHNFMVSIKDGVKVYQGVEVIDGKPVKQGWKIGKVVQRPHKVYETEAGLFVSLQITDDPVTSDNDACSVRCAQAFTLHPEAPSIATDV